MRNIRIIAWVNTQKIHKISKLSTQIFWVCLLVSVTLIFLTQFIFATIVSLICLVVLVLSGLMIQKVKSNFRKYYCEFNSEEAEELDDKVLFCSDSFVSFWSKKVICLVLHPVDEPEEIYVFSTPIIWYESINELPRHLRTHFQYKTGYGEHHNLHLIGLGNYPKSQRNYFVN